MDKFFHILSSSPLFAHISAEDLPVMLNCLNGKIIQLEKGEPVFLEGDPAGSMGIVLEGAIQILRDDYYGNRSVMTVAEPGELFAEAFACAGETSMPVSALALMPAQVMLLDCNRVLTVCPNACSFHNKLIHNLLQVLAAKNIALSQKIQVMSRKTTREKIMAFLSDQAKRRKSASFVIPFDRQALADHLGVERSAMSTEIGKLKKEGYIDTKGSRFEILMPFHEE